MKRFGYALLTALIGMVFSMSAYAAGVVGSKHDLSAGGGAFATGTTDDVCIFCHTPHNAEDGMPRLWNRKGNNGTYTMWVTDPTTHETTATANQSVNPPSLMCLSCHDGVTAFNALWNSPGTGDDLQVMTGGDNMLANPNQIANIGQDLTNDHPVSANGGANTHVNILASGPRVYDINGHTIYGSPEAINGGDWYVECGSCHNPHGSQIANPDYVDETTTPGVDPEINRPLFLRMDNANSALCLACHDK